MMLFWSTFSQLLNLRNLHKQHRSVHTLILFPLYLLPSLFLNCKGTSGPPKLP